MKNAGCGYCEVNKLGLIKNIGKKILWNLYPEEVRQFLLGNTAYSYPEDSPINTETALKYTAVFSCIRVLSETLAGMPIKLYRKTGDERIEANDIAAYDILHNKPNDEMTPFSFKEMGMIALNTGGNLVCERLVNKRGELLGLYPYEWQKVEIKRNKETKKLEYKIRQGSEGKTLTREQVFHVPGMSLDGIIGISPLQYAAESITLGLQYEKYGVNFYKNGALSSGVLETEKSLGDTAYQRLKEDFEKSYTGLKNAGKPIVLEDGAKFKGININPIDAQLLESKYFQIEDIARIYRVPQHLVNKLDRSTYSNIEQQALEFVMYTMIPWFKRWEECQNMQLLTQSHRKAGYYSEFKIDALLRGDMKTRAESYARARQWGWMSVNDIRRLENMSNIGIEGDIYLQPGNMIKAGEEAMKNQYKTMAEEIYKMIDRGEKREN
jgi:HK97 family phage portal protein